MSLLEIKNVSKKYGEEIILDNISFEVDKGETLSILGSSGSGKTTLLRCLNFLDYFDDGEIILNGEEYYSKKNALSYSEEMIRQKRKQFGYVFQEFNLFPQYTALENIAMPLKLTTKENIDSIYDKSRQLLKMMGLSERMDYYPQQLSGGQKQRVAIARALALSPDILCFDEPTSALDPELTGEVLKVIKELAANNTTMIIITHELEFAKEISDKVLFLDKGKAIEYGSSDEVFNNPKNSRTIEFFNSINNY